MTILNFLTVIGLCGLLTGSQAIEWYYFENAYLENVRSGDQANVQVYYNPWHNQTLKFLQTLSNADEVNPACRSSLRRWLHGLNVKETWALKFLEATGKTVNGKLIGRDVNFGSFEFCTNYLRNEADRVDFDGKYCMVSVRTKEAEIVRKQKSFRAYYDKISDRAKRLIEFNLGSAHGVCMPSSCNIDELASVANKILKPMGFNVLPATRCITVTEPEPLTSLQIFSLYVNLDSLKKRSS